MRKVITFTLLITFTLIFGYNYIMAKQVTSTKTTKTIINNPGNDVGQPSQEKSPAPEKEITKEPATPVSVYKPAEAKESSEKPKAQENKQASNSGTSSKKPAAEAKNSSKKPSSKKQYSVKVDISDQKTYVYEDGILIRAMICSTGIENEESKTPRGEYIINESGKKRGEWFFSNKYQEGAKYWVGFIGGTYLFHSVPMDIDRNIIQSEAEKLGIPASHGCIRLSVDDAYWFYKTIPSGSKLSIID